MTCNGNGLFYIPKNKIYFVLVPRWRTGSSSATIVSLFSGRCIRTNMTPKCILPSILSAWSETSRVVQVLGNSIVQGNGWRGVYVIGLCRLEDVGNCGRDHVSVCDQSNMGMLHIGYGIYFSRTP